MSDELQKVIEERELLAEAVEFYMNPMTYAACMFLFDPPTGGFDTDFESFDANYDPCDEDDPYRRDRPGRRARDAAKAIIALRASAAVVEPEEHT